MANIIFMQPILTKILCNTRNVGSRVQNTYNLDLKGGGLPTGSELVHTLEDLAEAHVFSTTLERDKLSNFLVEEILRELGPLLESDKKDSLYRGLKFQYPLNKNFRELELSWLPANLVARFEHKFSKLDRLSSDAHQARTQAAYIAGVLRPFNPKYVLRWFREREDLNVPVTKARIGDLERVNIQTVESLEHWAAQTADLFRELVVAPLDTNPSPLSKLAGQIGESSSRTYLQSWFAFVKKHRFDLVGYDGVDLNQYAGPIIDALSSSRRMMVESSPPAPSVYAPAEVSGFLQQAAAELKQLQDENDLLKSAKSEPETPLSESTPPWKIPALEVMPDGLTIYAESQNGERSSCNFGSLESAQSGRSNWLKTLALIWAGQLGSIKFDADLKFDGNQFRYSLPRWSLEEADEKLEQFVHNAFSGSESWS